MSVVDAIKSHIGRADEQDLRAIKKRFLALNHTRLLRLSGLLRPRERMFLEVLPLLFHVNHPLLPGFVSKRTPGGVAGYLPTRSALEAVRAIAKSFSYRKRAYRVFNIQALYLMGSSGTIAQSEQSDLDIWVCVRPDLTAGQRDSLREKAEAISQWAATLGLEAHLFVLDSESFRKGEHEALSRESSGSTQHHLLLEEFYRTGLLLAGRYPLWWLVPPGREGEYEAYAERLKSRRFVREHEYVDFGSPAPVPAHEFFGASLWLLYKGIESPYKAVLKLLLMESYASQYPSIDLLSLAFKRAIYEGVTDVDELDPYMMMLHRVEEYLIARGEPERLELVRRCFYYKVGIHLSAGPTAVRDDHRYEIMESLSQRWHWHSAHVLMLDSRPTWKIHRVMEERKALVDELMGSYRLLSAFAREHADSAAIDPSDLNMLGRKLSAAFERKSGKVDIISPGLSTSLVEKHLSIHKVAGEENWLLFRGEIKEDEVEWHDPLKRAKSLLELLAWSHFNRLMDANTVVTPYIKDGYLDARELRAVVERIQQLFPHARLDEAAVDELVKPPRILSSVVFVNLGIDPLSRFARAGIHLTSNRTDALSFSGLSENLALTFDQLVVNSWREVLTFRYTGAEALLECLCNYLEWTPLNNDGVAPPVMVYSFSCTRGGAIAHRVETLFRDVIRCFYENEDGAHARYVLNVGHTFYVLQAENDFLRYRRFDSQEALIRHLATPQANFSPVVLDAQSLRDTPLPLIYANNQPGVVQFFYRTKGDHVEIYVVDEKGSLFYQNEAFYDAPTLLNQFKLFLEAVERRRSFLQDDARQAQFGEETTFSQLVRDPHGRLICEVRTLPRTYRGRPYLNVQVIGDVIGDRTALSIYCDDREFSSLEFGDRLFREVARYVLERRSSGIAYPIYITDIDLSPTLLGTDGTRNLQTVHFLNYKKRIEDRLNQALASL